MSNELDSLLQELRAEYLSELPEKVDTIQLLFQEKQYDSLRNEFHKLKGTGQTYGLPEISQVCAVAENLCETSMEDLPWVITSAVHLLRKIYSARQEHSHYGIDQDADFIKMRSRCTTTLT